MVTVEQLAERLEIVGRLLNASAEDIRDLSLAPAEENIRAIGQALTSIFHVQRAIFASRPDLEPTFSGQVNAEMKEPNCRLMQALSQAYRLADAKRSEEAASFLVTFASQENSELHRRIALYEADRIKSR